MMLRVVASLTSRSNGLIHSSRRARSAAINPKTLSWRSSTACVRALSSTKSPDSESVSRTITSTSAQTPPSAAKASTPTTASEDQTQKNSAAEQDAPDEWALYVDPDFPGYGGKRKKAYFDYIDQFMALPNAELTLKEIKLVMYERFAGDVDSRYRLHKFEAKLDGVAIAEAVELKMYVARGAAAAAGLRSLGLITSSTNSDEWEVHVDPDETTDKPALMELYKQYTAEFSKCTNSGFKMYNQWCDSNSPRHRCEAQINGETIAVAVGTSKKHAKGAASKLALKARGASFVFEDE